MASWEWIHQVPINRQRVIIAMSKDTSCRHKNQLPLGAGVRRNPKIYYWILMRVHAFDRYDEFCQLQMREEKSLDSRWWRKNEILHDLLFHGGDWTANLWGERFGVCMHSCWQHSDLNARRKQKAKITAWRQSRNSWPCTAIQTSSMRSVTWGVYLCISRQECDSEKDLRF